LSLSKLPMSDFLDIAHYCFETDNPPSEKEVHEAKHSARSMIYGVYGVEYSWGSSSSSPSYGFDSNYSAESTPKTAMPKMTHTPYVPPTPMTNDPNNPFEGLDAPLG